MVGYLLCDILLSLLGAVARARFHLADFKPYIIYYGGVGIMIYQKNATALFT